MKLSPIDIFGPILSENAPPEIFYYYAKVLGKSENKCKNATFMQLIEWSYDAYVVPDHIQLWTERDYQEFQYFLNPTPLEWKKEQMITAWNFIKDMMSGNRSSFHAKLLFGFPTPKSPKTISPLLAYWVCSNVRPTIRLRGKTMEDLYQVSRALLFSGGLEGLLDTFQQTISLALLTNGSVEPIVSLIQYYDEMTEMVSKNVKRSMNTTDRFHFVRGHINGEIQQRLEMGYYQIPNDYHIPDLQHVQDDEEYSSSDEEDINMITFFQNPAPVDENFFHNTTTLPTLAMNIIGQNLSDFEFGNTYAICLRNRQVFPEFEAGRENICSIVRFAYLYGKDITNAEEPEKVKDHDLHLYPPLDDDFNASIPPKAYPLRVLKQLAYNQGIIETVDANLDEYALHEMLQVNELEPKFWLGLCEPVQNPLTLYHENVYQLEHPISFGVMGGPYYIFDKDELADFFASVGTLQNPASETIQYFTPVAIRQLIHLLGDEDCALMRSIQNIMDVLGSLEMKIQEFYTLYQKSEENKMWLEKMVWALHHAGMALRGWIDEGEQSKPLPIKIAVFDDYEKVEKESNRVIGNMLKLWKKVSGVKPELVECMKEMPIWKYKNGLYLRPSHEANTVEKRINLVLLGEQSKGDENSCIRLSSNYFCATSYRLAQTIGMNLGYDINDLTEIS